MEQDHENQRQLLERFKVLAERHLSLLDVDLRNLEKCSIPKRQEVLYVDILRHCYFIKRCVETDFQSDITELINNLEIVVELVRRRKMQLTAEVFNLLHKTIKTISQMIQCQLAGNESGQDMFLDLREHYTQIKSRHAL